MVRTGRRKLYLYLCWSLATRAETVGELPDGKQNWSAVVRRTEREGTLCGESEGVQRPEGGGIGA